MLPRFEPSKKKLFVRGTRVDFVIVVMRPPKAGRNRVHPRIDGIYLSTSSSTFPFDAATTGWTLAIVCAIYWKSDIQTIGHFHAY